MAIPQEPLVQIQNKFEDLLLMMPSTKFAQGNSARNNGVPAQLI